MSFNPTRRALFRQREGPEWWAAIEWPCHVLNSAQDLYHHHHIPHAPLTSALSHGCPLSRLPSLGDSHTLLLNAVEEVHLMTEDPHLPLWVPSLSRPSPFVFPGFHVSGLPRARTSVPSQTPHSA